MEDTSDLRSDNFVISKGLNISTDAATFIAAIIFGALLCFSQGRKGKSQHDPNESYKINRRTFLPRVSWGSSLLSTVIPSWIQGFQTLFKMQKEGISIFEEISRKYGSLYELPFGTVNVIGVTDPKVIHKLLTSTNPAHLNKPRKIYDIFYENYLNEGMISSEVQTWSHHRKIANRAFSYKCFQHYLKCMNSNGNTLTRDLIRLADKQNVIGATKDEWREITKAMSLAIYDIISGAMYGMNMFTRDESPKLLSGFVRGKEITFSRFAHPWKLIGLLWKFHPEKRELEKIWDMMNALAEKVIDKFRQEPEDDNESKPFTCIIDEMVKSGLSDKEIMSEIGTFFVAGFETTCTSLNTLLLHLALNPEIQRKCRDEINMVLSSKNGGDSLNIELEMDDLANMKYVERCIQENLRLTPTIPHFYRRLDEPLKVADDLEFLAGDNLLIVPWALHRDPKFYPEPLKFDPDRFLKEDISLRDSCSFVPFSGGKRNCIGEKFSVMEIKVLLACILSNFDVTANVKSLHEVKFMFELSIRPENEFHIIFTKRKS